MFRPNRTCTYYQRTNEQDIYGNWTFLQAVTTPCTVVSFDLKVSKTSMRSDSSASRGRAEEEVGMIRILFPTTLPFPIQERDVVVVDGYAVEVDRIFPQRDVTGRLDHYQVDFDKGTVPTVFAN